jgi:replicative DNA helicase
MLIENLFGKLLDSTTFFNVVFPHLKESYLPDSADRLLLKKITDYHERYKKIPTMTDLRLSLETDNSITVSDTESGIERLSEIQQVDKVTDEDLLIDEVEKYCQNKALENAILGSVEILEKNEGNYGEIEEKIKEALGVQFVVQIGHDYFSDSKARMLSYFEQEEVIPLNIELKNVAMGGGLVKKTLFIYMALTNVGKSVWMCHDAASLLMSGKNVLYITAEMSEKEILKRIDANILDIHIDELSPKLNKDQFKSRLKEAFNKTNGKLIVKQFPTGAANAYHIKSLLNELKLKKGFIPDVIILDYINLFSSTRLPASQAGSYGYIKAVTEEMRGLAVEKDVAILTATQFNRGASKKKSTDIDVDDVAESFGIAHTADWAGAIIQSTELREQGKYLLKVIKTRFGANNGKVYTIGIDFTKMKLKNLNADEQDVPLHIKDTLRIKDQEKDEENISIFDFSDDS